MAEVKWIKITTDIFDDEKIKLIDTMPDNDTLLVIWFKLLALAGKTNDNGLVYIVKKMPITDEMLATIFNRPLNTIRLALQTFTNFGMIEIDRHINIVNWEKHQNIQGLDKIREQARIRQERYRQKKALPETKIETKTETNQSNVTVTFSNATDIDLDIEEDIKINTNIHSFNNTTQDTSIGSKKCTSMSSEPNLYFINIREQYNAYGREEHEKVGFIEYKTLLGRKELPQHSSLLSHIKQCGESLQSWQQGYAPSLKKYLETRMFETPVEELIKMEQANNRKKVNNAPEEKTLTEINAETARRVMTMREERRQENECNSRGNEENNDFYVIS